jgi:hypothetical protein
LDWRRFTGSGVLARSEREWEAAALKEGGGSAGGRFTKGVEARIPMVEDERKRSRAQPPAAEQRMREEEAGSCWMESWAICCILVI